ncbi:helix-turn-helix domain-containing protein [Deinococcus sp. UYEF24]
MAAIEGLYTALGLHLAQQRRQQGVTQDALARELGLPRTAISNIERGRQRLLIHTFFGYARVLKMRPTELLEAFSGQVP